MFNRLLKTFTLAFAFLGLIYWVTKERTTPLILVNHTNPVKTNVENPSLKENSKEKAKESLPRDTSAATKTCETGEESTACLALKDLKDKTKPISTHTCIMDILPDVAEGALPSVVSVTTTQVRKTTNQRPSHQNQQRENIPGPFGDLFKEFFNFEGMPQMPRKIESQGSGFIVSAEKDGQKHNIIVTNYHVVKEELEGGVINNISVTFMNGARMNMTVHAQDPKSDIAVLSPKESKDQKALDQIPALEWGDSTKIRPGQRVLAIGNPFGLGSTVTDGIISYTKGRDIPSLAENSRFVNILPSLIQHSAQINFGSSGGVLLGIFKEGELHQGKIIGINTAISTPSGGNVGIGFSIPSNMAQEKITLMMKYGRVVYGWLGVVIEPMIGEKKDNFGIKEPAAFLIIEVMPNSPAQRAGLKVGDVIVAYNGKALDQNMRLERLINQTKPGTKVTLGMYRNYNFRKPVGHIDVFTHTHDDQSISLPYPYRIAQWKHSDATLFKALMVQKNVMFLILSLMLLIAVLNIVSSMTMFVKDKTKVIAILRSMGMQQKNILSLFIMSGCIIGISGTAVGTILGVVVSLHINAITQFLEKTFHIVIFNPELYFLSHLPSMLAYKDIALVCFVSLVFSLLATLYPAMRAAKLDPAPILR